MKRLLLLLVAATAISAGEVDTRELKPRPWAPTMPRDYTHDPLTAADWVGPDGIIYPLWTWAGVHLGEPGARTPGIPQRNDVIVTLGAELAGPDMGEAFTAALAAAVAQAGAAGGGVIRIAPGTFDLVRPLLVQHDRVVIRGSGRGRAVQPGGRDDAQETRLRFTFGYSHDGSDGPVTVAAAFPQAGRLTRDSRLCVYASATSTKASGEAWQGGGKSSHIHGLYVTITPHGGQPVVWAISRDGNDRKTYAGWSSFNVAGPTDGASLTGEEVARLVGDAPDCTVQVKVVWRWSEQQGKTRTQQEDSATGPVTAFTCAFGPAMAEPVKPVVDSVNNAIHFQPTGNPWGNSKRPILRDAKRGDTALLVDHPDVAAAAAVGVRPGAMLRIFTYTSQSFADAIERDGGTGVPRDQPATVLAVEPAEGGVLVRIEQPLQFDFPCNEGQVDTWSQEQRGYVRTGNHSTWIQAVQPLQECGVEDLVLEQTRRVWFCGLVMSDMMNSWMRNVRVERAGRDPASIGGIMNECRDCEFIDPRWGNNTGGGSAYVHGSSFGLYDGIYARNCRHAPNVTGHTACVFRNSRFDSSDMQWHQNWGRAHLFENCTVDAQPGTGSYGWGAFAQRSIADIHGPGMGPRNCIYNCDLIGSDGGIFLGGKSENPLILHNRVRAWTGPGLVLRYHVFDGIILGNVFAVQNRFEPAVFFGDPDPAQSRLARTTTNPKPLPHPGLGTANPGNDFIGNTLYGGNGLLADGSSAFGRVKSDWRRDFGNRVLPWDAAPPRPQPAMPSVFAAQQAHPGGWPPTDPRRALYPPDPAQGGPADLARNDGVVVAQINFRDQRGDRGDQAQHWHGAQAGEGWLADLGEAFGERPNTVLHYGWVGGKPDRVRQESIWSDPDFRYRTTAEWVDWQDLRPAAEWEKNRDLAWQIALEPGTYRVFLACGSPRKPERFSWPDEKPLPFLQRNDWLLNDVRLSDPGQSDVRRDSFWTTVTVGEDGRLSLRPAPTAITPRLAFVQIYRAP